jgi:hypothetical protein
MKPFLSWLLFSLVFIQPLFSQNTLDNAGLTSATPSAVAFGLRKLSSGYTGAPIKVRRASDNTEAIVAFDGTGTVSATSLVTFTPGVTVGSTFGTAQTGTIACDVPKTGTITIKAIKTGTITASNGSVAITGSGTSFTTEIVAGDRLFNGATNVFIGVVASVTDNFNLVLTNDATLIASAITYKTTGAIVTGTGTNFTGELSTGDRLFSTTNAYLGTVAAITNATTLTLNGVDAVAATAIPFKGTSATITGTGTSFATLVPGNLLISNNITLGIISSIASATSLTLATKAGGSVSGLAFKSTAGTIPFSTFYSATSVYINTWYDQSGNGRDAIQLKPGNQPQIVNAGTVYTVNGKISMAFSASLTSFLETSTVASYLDNTLYTFNKVTAEATTTPNLQLPISTTGGSGPSNTISHYGYRSSSQFTVAQYGNDQNFNATPSTSLELHTAVKISTASSQFYKNGISLGVMTSGAPSNLLNVGLLNIGFYTPTSSYYSGSISELTIFSTALGSTDLNLLNNNQLAYFNIATTYWTGAVSTDWTNTGNWSTGVVPTISSPAIVDIPAGKPFYPIIIGTSPANSINVDLGASVTVTGILQIAATINNQGTFTATAGTIQFVGAAQQAIATGTFAGNAVQNVVVNNPAGVALAGNFTVSGNLTFTSGKLSLSGYALTIRGLVTNTITGGLTGSSNSSMVINGSSSPALSFDQTTVGTTNSLQNLTINSSGQVVTLTNNLLLVSSGTTTFTAGKLAIGSTTLTIEGAVVNTANGGLTGSAGSNLTVDGTKSPTLSFDQTTPGTTNALNTFTLNCSGQTVTLNNSLVILSALNLSAGILADGGNQLTSTATLNLVAGTFRLGSATVATAWPAFATNAISTGGTVEYASGVSQTVSAIPTYQDLTISAAGGAVAGNNLTVNNILNLSAANPSPTVGALSMATYTLTMGASATTIGQGDVTGIVTRTTILPNITYTMGNAWSSITFPNIGTLPTQMSMNIAIGVIPSWKANAIARVYDFIQTGGSGTQADIKAHYLDTELNGNTETSLVDFSYRFAGPILTEHGKSNFNTTQNWVDLSNVNVAFFSSTFGNVQLSLAPSALTTLTWNGSTSTSWITSTNWTPNGGPSTNTILIIPDASTTPYSPSLPATASNGSLTIQANGIVNSSAGAQLSLNNAGLAWSNSGTFNAGTSTITFTNANATINGTTNFANLTIAGGASLLMTSGTITRIGGTMTNSGTWATGLLPNTVEYNGSSQTVINPNGSTLSYSNLIISGSGTNVLPAATLNIVGDLTLNATVSTTGNTIAMNGAIAQAINGTTALTLNNLSINNSSTGVSLNQNLNTAGTLTFTAGKLAIGGNTLTLSGNVVNTVPNGITGGLSSNLIVNGSVSPTLSFDQSAPGVSETLNNFTINSSGQKPLLGSNLEVDGTMTFIAGKLSLNGNTFTLNGAVTNTATGSLSGSGASNLVIGGGTNSPTLSFDQTTAGSTNLLNNFSINSPGQSASLANPLILSGSLNLTNGLVMTTTANSLTLTGSATFTGGSDSSYVNGPLIINTNAASAFSCPIGKNNTYRPVAVTPASSLPGVYTAEYFPIMAPAGTYTAGETGIATNEYWDIGKTSGPNATVTLQYIANNTWSTGSPATLDNIYVAHLNAGNWDMAYGSTIPGNSGAGPTAVTSMTLTSFSPFTFGYSPITTLPVTLLTFKATVVDQTVVLNWTTANEFSLENYGIERSPDGGNFYNIGSVPATNTLLVKNYTWTDHNPLPGVSFYRLKIADVDAAFKYSNVSTVDISNKKSILVYPNPVTNNTILLGMYGQTSGEYVINLYNINGAKIFNSQVMIDGTDGVRSINLNKKFPTGVYYLEIVGPDRKLSTFKIIIN